MLSISTDLRPISSAINLQSSPDYENKFSVDVEFRVSLCYVSIAADSYTHSRVFCELDIWRYYAMHIHLLSIIILYMNLHSTSIIVAIN